MTAVSKGAAYERRAHEMLLVRGYLLEKAYRSVIWVGSNRPISRRVDLFGCFDRIGVHPSRWPIYVQVTTHHRPSKSDRRAKILDTFGSHMNDLMDVELWSFGYLSSYGHHLAIERLDAKVMEWGKLGRYRYDGTALDGTDPEFDFWPPHLRERLRAMRARKGDRSSGG